MDLLSLTWWRNVYSKGGRAFALGCAFVFAAPIVITAGFNLRQHPGQSEQQMQGGTICTVNGDPVSMRDLQWISSGNIGGAPGRAHAAAYGGAIFALAQHQVIEQLCKKQNIHATDADVDRAIAKYRESKVGDKATDAEWENYLSDRMHASAAEFREYMQSQADVEALLNHYKKAETVTPDEAKNQYSEVRVIPIFITTGASPAAPKAKPLTDAEALKKATDLRAKAAAGGDMLALAKANSTDPRVKTLTAAGSEWTGEFQKAGQESPFGAFFYGNDFDAAIQKTTKGQLTDVVKTSGFQNGYIFGKVLDRRQNLPKDFDIKKEIESLQQMRAFKKLDAIIKAAVKSAKVVFAKDQSDKKAYYDYGKLEAMQMELRGSFGAAPSADAPTQAEFKAQEALIDTDFEAALKSDPEDTTAILLVASSLEAKRMAAPPAEQASIRDRLITLYESAFKTTEDIDKRFTLADLYHDKHDDKSTFKQYNTVIKLLNSDPSYDLPTRQKELGTRNRLLLGLRALPAADVPEAAAAITAQEARVAELQTKITADQAKQKEEQARQAAAAAEAAKTLKNTAPGTAGPKTPAINLNATPGVGTPKAPAINLKTTKP